MAETTEVLYSVDPDAETIARRAARFLVDRAQEAAAARGRARIAISGGDTPRRMFALLAEAPYLQQMPWEKLELYWVDERCVPPDSPDSNYGVTRATLLDKVPLRPEQIFRIEGEREPEEAADRYESRIRASFRLEGAEMPVFDVIALGMGPDGHTASLFPHTEALHEMMRIVVANHVHQKDAWRVTLTWPVLNQARGVFFHIEGADKADVLRRVLLGAYDPEELPSQLVRPMSGQVLFMLDSAAASLLPPPAQNGIGRLEVGR